MEAENGSGLETFIGFGGQVRFKCPEPTCKYDHYSEAVVVKHWSESHKEETGQGIGVTLFDDDSGPEREPLIILPSAYKHNV